MIGRTVGSLAVAALGAQAFLLPPGVTNKEDKATLGGLAIDTTSRGISVPCSDCIFPTQRHAEEPKPAEADDTFWIQGGANNVELNFQVTKAGGDDTLTLDGYILYPPTSPMDEFESRPTVLQPTHSEIIVHTVTDYTLLIGEENVPSESPEGDKVVHLTYHVLALDGQRVTIDPVAVQALQGTNGDLMILSVDVVPAPSSVFGEFNFPPTHGENEAVAGDEKNHRPEHHPMAGRPQAPKECLAMMPNFICKLMNALEDKAQGVAGMRKHGGCAGKKGNHGPKRLPGHIKPHLDIFGDKDGHGPENHHDRPHHGRPDGFDGPDHPHPHGRHGRHHGHHGSHYSHLLHRIVRGIVMILIPVMAGITMGMTVSLLGMLVGRLIGYLWIKFRCGGKRGYASVAQQEIAVEAAKDEVLAEKRAIALEEEQSVEELPAYESAPAYMETAAEEK